MSLDDEETARLRRLIREELSQGRASAKGKPTLKERLKRELRLTGMVLAALAVVLAPAFLFLYHLAGTEAFDELGEFLRWFWKCMGAQCP